jgi:ATP-dependent RNA helicase DeaD
MISEKFRELGLSEELLHAIKLKGFEEPTEIQQRIIPIVLKSEKDIIGQAQTGTGKTAAFALPIIDLIQAKAKKLQVIILVPTRELAIQVSEEINSLKGHKNIHVAPIYGGQSYDTQFKKLKKGVDIIVGTPGRVIDHLDRGSFSFNYISFLVLDEADEMLNMGFLEDIERILSVTNKDRKTFLFSATMPNNILKLAKKYMRDCEIIKAKNAGQSIELTDQIYFEVKENDKLDALCRIIDTTNDFYGLVFCRTKNDVDFVSSKLTDRGYDVEGLHGDISQNAREKILGKFRKQKVNILIATDVAARGLDIFDLTHVINYALPQDPENYLHRIGRTGRAGKEGTAITFVTPDEFRKMMYIKKATQTEIRKERIPNIKDVVRFRKDKIKDEVKSLISNETSKSYQSLAKEILHGEEPEKVIAALLNYTFKNQLEEHFYSDIHDLYEPTGFKKKSDKKERKNNYKKDSEKTFIKDSKKGTRMFLALGKKDELNPRMLLKILKKEANITPNIVDDIQIMETFSFFTIPSNQADNVLVNLNRKSKGNRALVEKAKPSR